ncbi:MAG: hypothetical protein FWC47_08590 [Oscillospiraceae bacterium]|nr:hypothetical protein [Oscillospiraceae bacterium]
MKKMLSSITFALLIIALLSTNKKFTLSNNIMDSSNISDVLLETCSNLLTSNVDVNSLNQENVLEKAGISVVDDNVTLLDNQIHESDYGGSYIDDEGNLNVLLVDGSSSLNNIVKNNNRNISKKVITSNDNLRNNKKVILKKCKFSQRDLMSVLKLITCNVNNMINLYIGSGGINTEKNKVVIGILNSDKSKENNIKNFVKKNSKFTSNQVNDILSFECLTKLPSF